MKSAKELYPNRDHYGFDSICEYQPILEQFGQILLQVSDQDYQGDSRVLYRDFASSKVGWLQFGWGSCSGCDALQACDSYVEVDSLIRLLHESIKWFDSVEEALEFFTKHDWKGDYSWCSHSSNQAMFVSQAIKLLKDLL